MGAKKQKAKRGRTSEEDNQLIKRILVRVPRRPALLCEPSLRR